MKLTYICYWSGRVSCYVTRNPRLVMTPSSCIVTLWPKPSKVVNLCLRHECIIHATSPSAEHSSHPNRRVYTNCRLIGFSIKDSSGPTVVWCSHSPELGGESSTCCPKDGLTTRSASLEKSVWFRDRSRFGFINYLSGKMHCHLWLWQPPTKQRTNHSRGGTLVLSRRENRQRKSVLPLQDLPTLNLTLVFVGCYPISVLLV